MHILDGFLLAYSQVIETHEFRDLDRLTAAVLDGPIIPLDYEQLAGCDLLPGEGLRELEEAGKKDVSSARRSPTRDRIFMQAQEVGHAVLQKARQQATSAERRKLTRRIAKLDKALAALVARFIDKKVGYQKLRRDAVALVSDAHRDAFEMGLNSAGVHKVAGFRGVNKLYPNDKKYLEGVVRDETKHLTKMLRQVREHGDRRRWAGRVRAYANALRATFQAGRVLATPPNTVIHWIGKLDDRMCAGCRKLVANSPYTVDSLPTTPGAGATPCRFNCRCRLLIRPATGKTVRRMRQRAAKARDLVKELDRIKAGDQRRGQKMATSKKKRKPKAKRGRPRRPVVVRSKKGKRK